MPSPLLVSSVVAIYFSFFAIISSIIYAKKLSGTKTKGLSVFVTIIGFISLIIAVAGILWESNWLPFESKIFDKLNIGLAVSLFLLFCFTIIECFVMSAKKNFSSQPLAAVSGVLALTITGTALFPITMLIHAIITKKKKENEQYAKSYEKEYGTDKRENKYSYEEKKVDNAEIQNNYTYEEKKENNAKVQNANNVKVKSKKRHWKKSDFSRAGMNLHLIPIDNKVLKGLKRQLGKEGMKFMAEATRPFAIKSLVKIIILLIFFVTVSIIMVSKGGVEGVVYALILYFICSYFFCRMSMVINGFSELGGGIVSDLLNFVCLILSLPFKIIFLTMSIAFGGKGGKAKHLAQPRIAIPENVGFNALIVQGEADELYYKMENMLDRYIATAEMTHYEDKIKDANDALKIINSDMPYSSAEGQTALAQKKAEIEKIKKDAEYHLDRK